MRRLERGPIGWHVFARGARRLRLFHDDQDYLQFITILRYALSKSGCLPWAFVLMSNHYHLVLYGSSQQLTACMRVLDRLYAAHHNKKYQFSGHCFDGPYQAYPQPSPLLLLRTTAYVFLNPVDAGLCARPEDYAWSCYKSYTEDHANSPMHVNPAGLLSQVSDDPRLAWELFHQAMERERRRPKFRSPAKLTMVQVHSQQFEWLLEYAREHADRLEGEDPNLVALYWGECYGLAPRAMAEVLGLDPMTVSRWIYKLRKRVERDPALAKILAPP